MKFAKIVNPKTLAVSVSIQLVSKLFLILTLFGCNILVARHLGASGLGTLALFNGLLVILTPLARLGSGNILKTFRNTENLISAFNYSILQSCLGLIPCGILLWFILGTFHLDNSVVSIQVIMTLTLALGVFELESIDAILRGDGSKEFYTYLIGSSAIIFHTLIGLLLNMDLIYFFTVKLAQQITTTIYLVYRRKLYLRNIISGSNNIYASAKSFLDEVGLKKIAVCSLLGIINSLSNQSLTRIDQLMLPSFVPVADAGVYSVAVKLTESPFFVFQTYSANLLTRFKRTNGMTMPILQSFLVFCLLITFGFIAISPLIVNKFYGLDFIQANTYLPYMSSYIVLYAFESVSANLLIAKGDTSAYAYRLPIAALLNIALNLVLIPKYGVPGAIISTIASYVSIVFTTFAFDPTFYRLNKNSQ